MSRVYILIFVMFAGGYAQAACVNSQVNSDGVYTVEGTSARTSLEWVSAACYCQDGDQLVSGGCTVRAENNQFNRKWTDNIPRFRNGRQGWLCQRWGQNSRGRETVKVRLICKQ